MAAQPENIDKMFHTPDYGSYDNVMETRITNKATGKGFNMDNLVMTDVKTLNSVFSEYKKNTAPMLQGFCQLRSIN